MFYVEYRVLRELEDQFKYRSVDLAYYGIFERFEMPRKLLFAHDPMISIVIYVENWRYVSTI